MPLTVLYIFTLWRKGGAGLLHASHRVQMRPHGKWRGRFLQREAGRDRQPCEGLMEMAVHKLSCSRFGLWPFRVSFEPFCQQIKSVGVYSHLVHFKSEISLVNLANLLYQLVIVLHWMTISFIWVVMKLWSNCCRLLLKAPEEEVQEVGVSVAAAEEISLDAARAAIISQCIVFVH